MKPPEEYVDVINTFMAMTGKAVKIEGANKEDIACLRMVAYMQGHSIEIKSLGKTTIALIKKEPNASEN